MEYCDGGDLGELIKSQNGIFLEEKQIVFWFKQICLAMQACIYCSLHMQVVRIVFYIGILK